MESDGENRTFFDDRSKSDKNVSKESTHFENDSDLLIGAIEMTIEILRQGREVQKISVIRKLPELIDDHGQECIDKVLPIVKEVFKMESSNLDIHCEGAFSLRNILTSRQLVSRFASLSEDILDEILLNATRQKDHLSATAWLQTLVEIVDHVPQHAVRSRILPIVLIQADASQRLQRRDIATKLVEKLCLVLDAVDVRSELAPCARMLCQDPNANVRTSMGQRLSVVANSLCSAKDSVSLILPCLIELCKDEDDGVREAILNSIGALLPYFDKDSLERIVIPLLRNCSEHVEKVGDKSKTAVARNLGSWLYILREVVSPTDRAWFLAIYQRLASDCFEERANNPDILGRQGPLPLMTQSDPEGLSLLEMPVSDYPTHVACRRMCAYNFPCMVLMFNDSIYHETLLSILEKLVVDPDETVRCSIAAGFHEVVVLLPTESSLIESFIELIRWGETEIVGNLAKNMDKILPRLYDCANRLEGDNGIDKGYRCQLDRILLACNRLVRGSGAWRNHEAFLRNIACLIQSVSGDDLHIGFVPMLKEEVLTARALPCRVAAAESLLLFLRHTESFRRRQSLIDFFVQSLCNHPSCHKRQLFIDVIALVLRLFSRNFFKVNFLVPAFKLARDPVPNIRLKICKLLPNLKITLLLPNDEHFLCQLENIMKDMLKEEMNGNNRQAIQVYAREFTGTKFGCSDDQVDREKENEENKRWKEPLIVVRTPQRNNQAQQPQQQQQRQKSMASTTNVRIPPSGFVPNSSSRLRLQRPKTAVVRPQPQIVITKRSPSPMPLKVDNQREATKWAKSMTLIDVQNRTKIGHGIPQRVVSSTPRIARPQRSSSTTPNVSRTTVQLAAHSTANSCRSSVPVPDTRRGFILSSSNSTSSIPCSVQVSSAVSPSRLSSNYSDNLSSSTLRRSRYGLIKVQSSSAVERKPGYLSFKVRT